MIDIGANLSNEQFKNDIESILLSAKNSDLSGIVLTSTDLKSFNKNIDIINKYQHIIPIYNTLGLHPHYADNYLNFFAQFENLMNDKIVSIGEFGLDYFRMLSTRENQIQCMSLFLEKEKNYNLPLFMHERNAQDDFISILNNQKAKNKKVVHCFTGNTQALKKYLELDCFIGITGWFTDIKRGIDLKNAIEYIPLEKLLIETDCPYLAPKNKKPYIHRNEPAFLIYIAKGISEIKKIPLEQILEVTKKNSIDFFSLTPYNEINKKKKI